MGPVDSAHLKGNPAVIAILEKPVSRLAALESAQPNPALCDVNKREGNCLGPVLGDAVAVKLFFIARWDRSPSEQGAPRGRLDRDRQGDARFMLTPS
ncbi:MAG TPA: hypothetical protein VM390_05505 [Acidimicrobiales bacterium]|jgi:hypothetical protein|nr:hypothetical protein [Acidimicrobiales bacterium]